MLGKNTYYELNVMFRDSGNYKDTGIVIVDAETYNNIKGAINSGGEITIEEIGLTVDYFFNKVIKRPYDEDSDHNFIEISLEDQYFVWLEQYKPIQNHIDTNASYSGAMFETFGEEVEYVRAYPDQKKVWTLLEADGKQYISAGYHHVNRLGYFITEIAWEAGTEEFYSE